MQFVIKAPAQKFSRQDERLLVIVPPTLLSKLTNAKRLSSGNIHVSLKIGHSTWDGLLAPMGRGNYFAAIPPGVIDNEDIEPGDIVTLMVLVH